MACLIGPAVAAVTISTFKKKIPAQYHPEWLLAMLWGGTIMLIVDHIVSGEIILVPPFFTAGLEKIFWEVIQVGVPMTLVTVLVWLVMVAVAARVKVRRELVS